MKRPTLIARGATPLVQAQYSKVEVDPDAYGIGKGVGALGEGLQNLAGSAFKYGQIKEQKREETDRNVQVQAALAKRADQDSTARGLQLLELAEETAGQEYAAAVVSNDPEMEKVRKASGSSKWIVNRTQALFSQYASEKNWSPPLGEDPLKEYEILKETKLIKVQRQYQNIDIEQGIVRRTADSNSNTKAFFERLNAMGPVRPEQLLDEVTGYMSLKENESGIDKATTLRSVKERLLDTLSNNPFGRETDPARLNKVAKKMRELGISEDFIGHYLKQPDPVKLGVENIKTGMQNLLSKGEMSGFDYVSDAQVAQFVSDLVANGYSEERALGLYETLRIEKAISSGLISPSKLNGRTAKSLLETPDTVQGARDLFKSTNIPEDQLLPLLSRAKSGANELLVSVKKNPARFAESRSPLVSELSKSIIPALEAQDQTVVLKALTDYSRAVQTTLADNGFSDTVDPNETFAPASLVDALIEQSNSEMVSPIMAWSSPKLRRHLVNAVAGKSDSPVVVAMAVSALVPPGLPGQERHVQKSLLVLNRGAQISPKVREELDQRVTRYNPEGSLEIIVTSALKSQEVGGASATTKSILKGSFDQPSTGATGWNILQGIIGTSRLSAGASNNLEKAAINYIYSLIATDPRDFSKSIPDAVENFSTVMASSGLVSFESNGARLVQWVPVKEATGFLDGLFGEFSPENWGGYKDASTSFNLAVKGLNHVVSQGLAQESRGGLTSFEPGLRELFSRRTFGFPFFDERTSAAISISEARTFVPQLKEMDSKQLQSLSGAYLAADPSGSGDLIFVKNNWSSSPITKGVSIGSGAFANAILLNGRPLRVSRRDLIAAAAYVENRDAIDENGTTKVFGGSVQNVPSMMLSREEKTKRDVNRAEIIQKKLDPYFLNQSNSLVTLE